MPTETSNTMTPKQPEPTSPASSSVIRLKAKVANGITEVKALITHPMETGLAKQGDKPIPAHFIEEVVCEHNGKPILTTAWGSGISKDPYLAFKFKGGQAGEKVKLSWKDNLGETSSTEVEIET